MTERQEVLLEQGFVLHRRPYRNSSQLIECMTCTYGRVGLIAQASRRSQSRQRALLQPFHPLRLSWVRRRELGRLIDAETAADRFDVGGEGLFAGFYANELILRLMARDDPNAAVFDCYAKLLTGLAGGGHVSRSLRVFELDLLGALGYGLELDHDVDTGEPLQPERRYIFEIESGPRQVGGHAGASHYSGRELIALGSRTLADPDSLRAAKRLLRTVLDTYLGDRPLNTRSVLMEVVDSGLGG